MSLSSAECEKIVWAEVKDLSFDTGISLEQQSDILLALCRAIRHVDGRDFSTGVDLPERGKDAVADAVRGIVRDEYSQPIQKNPYPGLLLWPSIDGIQPNDPPLAFRTWDYSDFEKVKRFGPLRDKNTPQKVESLYLFACSDKPMAYGSLLFTSKLSEQKSVAVPPKYKLWGACICIAALLFFLVVSFSTMQIGNLSRLRVNEFEFMEGAKACSIDTQNILTGMDVSTGLLNEKWRCREHEPSGDSKSCCTLWEKAKEEVFSKNWLPWIEGQDYYLSGKLNVSLLIPFIALMVSIASLLGGVGLAAKGNILAVFIDPQNNRMSLSRFQAVSWTILLLGGYITLAMFNIGVFAGIKVILQQLIDSGKEYQVVIDRLLLFPRMDFDLWILLGITAGSPFLSAVCSGQKSRMNLEGVSAGSASSMNWAEKPRVTDLFFDADKPRQGHLDLTRLQNLVFTSMLLVSYFQLLFKSLSNIGPGSLMLAIESTTPVFPTMPSIDSSFLALLVLSHGVYLMRKLQ